VEIVQVAREPKRPAGRRFGVLVHALLASVPLDGDLSAIHSLATVHGRILGATQEEIAAAADAVQSALSHSLFTAAREALQHGRCRREVPIAWRDADGALLEGVIDLAFETAGRWTVIDFKTDEEFGENEAAYRRQIGIYGSAIQATISGPVSAILMRV
jgi:ATP-dependent exoDNAse (exonuclease V) beta subunit